MTNAAIRRALASIFPVFFLLGPASSPAAEKLDLDLFAPSNLVAWCIVPFDAKKRGPEERAAMLQKLGITQLAYDYRAEHIATFDAELEALKRHDIRLRAWWFPTVLNDEARLILDTLKRHRLQAQLWVMGAGEAPRNPEEERARVDSEAERIRALAQAAAAQGCQVALYNHGGWFGEPENQIRIIEKLVSQGVTNVGIVYNLHHGHEHLGRFPQLLQEGVSKLGADRWISEASVQKMGGLRLDLTVRFICVSSRP